MPAITTTPPSVTFRVDWVWPARTRLDECRAHEAIRASVGEIESCSDYHGTVVKDVRFQPLLAAVFLAFSEHRPLVLTPDAVWLTIAQGVAHHMAIHGERLRERFVSHEGKLDLVFTCQGWADGSPENPWAEAFASWAGQIRDHVGADVHDALACDFSTTGPIDRAAGHVVMMDVFERYFHYLAVCICGIPTVTLEGTPDDWQRVAQKVEGLAPFDMDWWLPSLRQIAAQLVRASRGDVDKPFWQDICKQRSAYGGAIINGWVARLFPYLRAFHEGPCTRRNPIFETGEGFQTLSAPSGLSRVPFTFKNLVSGRDRRMEAIGGLVGVTQDAKTLALRPKVGWAVLEADKLGGLIDRVIAEHVAAPGMPREAGPIDASGFFPADLCEFYSRADGATLFAGTAAECRLLSREESSRDRIEHEGPGLHRIARFADGGWLAMGPPTFPRTYDRHECVICLGRDDSTDRPRVARSFTELLERLLAGGIDSRS